MEQLLELLKNNTSKMGSYIIRFNDHKSEYIENEKSIRLYYNPMGDKDIEEELNEIDFGRDIYEVIWYKTTPVGLYIFYGNEVDTLIKKVKSIVEHKLCLT